MQGKKGLTVKKIMKKNEKSDNMTETQIGLCMSLVEFQTTCFSHIFNFLHLFLGFSYDAFSPQL